MFSFETKASRDMLFTAVLGFFLSILTWMLFLVVVMMIMMIMMMMMILMMMMMMMMMIMVNFDMGKQCTANPLCNGLLFVASVLLSFA